jgi:HlyD family secretion protein
LQAAQSRAEDLLITAPTDGVVELARGGEGSGAGALGGLDDLAGSAEGLDPGDVSGLLGGGDPSTSSAGPIAVGAEVATGQALLTIFDLGAFLAVSRVDEIDVVEVEEGQDVTVLVDAFPDATIDGVVDHVAIEPEAGATGGVVYPVSVRLRAVPTTVNLRVGLSGSVEIVTAVVESDTVVPSSALRRQGEQDVVLALRDDIFVEVPVRVRAIGEVAAAVEGDLATGDLVVVEGIEEVADGDPVPAEVRTGG